MKKIILTITLTGLTTLVFGQAKNDAIAAKNVVKPVYEKFVKVPVAVYNQLADALHQYKDILIYDPKLTADESRKAQANIDSYLFQLPKNLKIDSAIVK